MNIKYWLKSKICEAFELHKPDVKGWYDTGRGEAYCKICKKLIKIREGTWSLVR